MNTFITLGALYLLVAGIVSIFYYKKKRGVLSNQDRTKIYPEWWQAGLRK